MKEILKKDWMYLILICVLLVMSYMQVSMFRFGFFTAYDEAYFLLKLQEAYDMSVITGKSQWNLLAVHWFPYLDLTSKIYSYLASAILIWATIIVSTITSCIVFDKRRVLKYAAIIALIFLPLVGGGLSYVPMQTAVLCWALCAFVLFHHSQIPWQKAMFAAICGILISASMFIIIPAALVLVACIVALIVILYWKDKKSICLYTGSGVVGALLMALYVHICVCPLPEILDAMLFAASYIGKSGYHYDGMSFILQFGLFFRDCIFVLVFFTGAYWISQLIKNKHIAGLIYIALLLMYNHYQVKPVIAPSMFLASVFVIPFFFGQHKEFSWRVFLSADTWYTLFLVAFPLIASFGTNTALSGRISCFLVSWLFLWFAQDGADIQEDWRYVRLGALILFMLPLTGIYKSYVRRDNTYHFTRGNKNFAEIAIMECQKDYFDKVYDILEEYNYEPHKSAILTACYDYCCLYAFDAVNAANYHQVQNFAYFPKEKMIEPDFIFLCKWDSIVMAKELEEMPWGWPEEFDKYYVGTPEPEGAAWTLNPELETRHLYCRRKLKKQVVPND